MFADKNSSKTILHLNEIKCMKFTESSAGSKTIKIGNGHNWLTQRNEKTSKTGLKQT